jgi:hypothetical protein
MCLRQQMPPAGINPVVDNARSHLRAEIEGSTHSALDAAIPESRFGRPALQITRKRHSSVERRSPPMGLHFNPSKGARAKFRAGRRWRTLGVARLPLPGSEIRVAELVQSGCNLGLQSRLGRRSIACDQPGEPALSRIALRHNRCHRALCVLVLPQGPDSFTLDQFKGEVTPRPPP